MGRVGAWAFCGLLIFAAADAFATAVDDGNAGLSALNKGDYAGAIRLFTRALKSGQLTGGDKEFAYLNRGKAYLGSRQYDNAIGDFKAAIKLAPDDNEAADALAQAQSEQSQAGTATVGAASARVGWGVLASLAGRYFWYETLGKKPHQAVLHFEWGTPGQVLLFAQHDKDGITSSGEYKLDPAANAILWVQLTDSGVQYWGTTQPSATSMTGYYFQNGVAKRTIATDSGGGSIAQKTQSYTNGSWQDTGGDVTLVEASEADVRSAGFLRDGR